MDCTEVEAHIALFIGGDLEAPLAALVAAHLGACQGCSTRLEAARGARSALLGLAQLEGGAGTVDLWPAVRAGLVAEGLCHPAEAVRGEPVRTGRLLRFARASAGLAAAALALLLWRPWVMEPLDTTPRGGVGQVEGDSGGFAGGSLAGGAAPFPASETGLAGLVVPASGPGVAEAEVLPSFLEMPSATGGLRRAGPEDELLRNLARPFSGEARRIHPIHLHGQGDWSLASDGELR